MLREFSRCSLLLAVIGLEFIKVTRAFFPPHTQTGNSGGHVQFVARLLKVCLTILSSRL